MQTNLEKEIKAVIFDLDGTLTDTEKFYQKAWPEALAHFGYNCEPWMPLELRSLGRPYAPERFREWFGQDFDYNEVREYRKAIVAEMINAQGIPLKPGAKEILVWLRGKGILTCIATANDYERTKGYLLKLGLFDNFDRIICSDMVKLGKPAPDIYAYACEQLELSPDRTFAVEDSPNGVTSAYLAGCNVIMVPDLTQPDEELSKKLYAKVDCLLDIRNLL